MDNKFLFIIGILLVIGSVAGYTLTMSSITSTFVSARVQGQIGGTVLSRVNDWNPLTVLTGSAGAILLLIAVIGAVFGSAGDE